MQNKYVLITTFGWTIQSHSCGRTPTENNDLILGEKNKISGPAVCAADRDESGCNVRKLPPPPSCVPTPSVVQTSSTAAQTDVGIWCPFAECVYQFRKWDSVCRCTHTFCCGMCCDFFFSFFLHPLHLPLAPVFGWGHFSLMPVHQLLWARHNKL